MSKFTPKNKKLILITFLLLVCSALIYVYTNPTKPVVNYDLISKIYGVDTVTLEINGVKYEDKISGQTNVYFFMEQLQNEGKINFKDETYIGMGKLIEEINGLKNGEKNWIYYVNGEKANIGVSNYKIKSGDVVSWKYEQSIN